VFKFRLLDRSGNVSYIFCMNVLNSDADDWELITYLHLTGLEDFDHVYVLGIVM
jgi:hypothetical protein